MINVYVPASAIAREAMETTVDDVHDLENSSSDSIKIIISDFNHYKLGKSLLWYQQEVMCTTCGDCTLDQFFCNAKDAHAPQWVAQIITWSALGLIQAACTM